MAIRPSRGARPLLALVTAWLALGAAAPAGAQGHLGMQGGFFIPWQGDVGYSLALQFLSGSNSRWGGEFEFRQFDSKISGVRDVEVDSFNFRGMWQYHFAPDAALAPYVGLGLGFVVTDVDSGKVNAVKGRHVRDDTGAGLDALFLIGLAYTFPGAPNLSLYGEGRFSGAFELTGREDGSGVISESIGGASGNFGLRFHF